MVGIILGGGSGGGTDVSDTTATTADVLPGKDFYNAAAEKVEGIMATKAAATLTPSSTVDGVIAAGQYLLGAQTLPKDADFVPENIKSGVNIWGKTGTFTSDATATSSHIKHGETAYVNGVKVTGIVSTDIIRVYDNPTSQTSGDTVSDSFSVHEGFVPIMIAGTCRSTLSTTLQISAFIFHNGGSPNYVGEKSESGIYYEGGCNQTLALAEITALSVSGTTLSYTIKANDIATQYEIKDGSTWDMFFFGVSITT